MGIFDFWKKKEKAEEKTKEIPEAKKETKECPAIKIVRGGGFKERTEEEPTTETETYLVDEETGEFNLSENKQSSNQYELVVDEEIGKIYNLIIERIGKDNCTFLVPYNDNSVILNKIQELNKNLQSMGLFQNDTVQNFNYDDITSYTEAPKSGQKGKLFFLNSDNEPCSTEQIAVEYYNNNDFFAIRAEVNFWQIIFCLTFFEEIYCKFWDLSNDIPFDYFQNSFYFMRKDVIEKKIRKIAEYKSLKKFIKSQIEDFGNYQSRLLYPWGLNFNVQNCYNDFFLNFFDVINKQDFINIMLKYVESPNNNRAGLPDLIIYNENSYKLVEVKKSREQLRDAQIDWINYLINKNIPIEIIRIKGI